MKLRSLILTVLLFFCGSLGSRSHAGQSTKTLDIYWIDVEGGAATLIVTPTDESILIDTGSLMPGNRDAKRIHETATQVAHLKKIDHLIVTHFHSDHFGGAAELGSLMPIENVYDNGIPDKDPDGAKDSSRFLKSIQPYREIKANRRVIKPNDLIPLRSAESGPKMSVRCLAAKQEFVTPFKTDLGGPIRQSFTVSPNCSDARTKEKDTSDNANSVVTLTEFGPFHFFNAGDLTWNVEAGLVCPINLVGPVDVFQVTHHGLDQSNNPILVKTVAPTVAVMSNGPRKGCETETFATFKSTPSVRAIYQIHRNVRANQSNTDPEYIANTDERCQASFIQCTVKPDGKEYTLSIPAKSHSRVFQTRP